MARVRLDTLLAERGLFASRSRAAASVAAGEVLVGADRLPATRPSQLVAADVPLELADAERYVSRGGIKLANALDAFGVTVDGRLALDVGASTGGFTDVLLRRGAARVAAVDVARDELSPVLRGDPRVEPLCLNARELTPADLPFVPDLLVVDVSFISATKVLTAALGCLAPRFDALVMVKPQFEVGPGRVGKNGVVRDPEERRAAIVDVAASAYATVLGFASSGLAGPKGNRETFVWLAEPGRPGGVADVEAAVRDVDP
ncbi:MAG TPA: TlyA family RNA methyltransferase [Solirubrobacteraceae bacterium]|jgi:23S rRNA (cytidine1920-2'-O)/16S rRNA (cytidine1409-2'-O)-methyltransferase